MKPKFNEEKTTQIACKILELDGGEMKSLKLMKILYLVDRKALSRWGFSITSDKYVAMSKGMVLSKTLDLINEESLPASYWKQHISAPEDYNVRLLKSSEYDELSRAELELTEEVFREFGHQNRWDLVNKVHHKLPEWNDPKGSSIQIELQAILKVIGKTEEEISEITEDLEEFAEFERLISK